AAGDHLKTFLKTAAGDSDWLVRFPAEQVRRETSSFEYLGRQKPTPEILKAVRAELAKKTPNVLALRAAGKLRDAGAVGLLAPWLKKHVWEYHAAEAAVALGRIGTPEAVAALWAALRSEVPV